MTQTDVVIVDLDGTLADNEHRSYLDRKKQPNGDDYHKAAIYDRPNHSVVRAVAALRRVGVQVVVCTGRPERHRALTEEWLRTHDIVVDKVLMRQSVDFRKDAEVKRDMLYTLQASGMWPILVIEDRPSVVAMYKAMKIPCLMYVNGQWANGDPEA